MAVTLRIRRFLSKTDEEDPGRLVLGDSGFDLYLNGAYRGGVLWREIDRIAAFKVDRVTYDLICMEFSFAEPRESFAINEEVDGFWEMAKRVKDALPASQQQWESVVVRQAYAGAPVVIYQRVQRATPRA